TPPYTTSPPPSPLFPTFSQCLTSVPPSHSLSIPPSSPLSTSRLSFCRIPKSNSRLRGLFASQLELICASTIKITVMAVILYFLLTETKGVPIEETSLLWRKHKFWRRIVYESNDAEKSLLEER
ncbi:hypothetical protein V2J09_016030, partial [Rumex salicifolius]